MICPYCGNTVTSSRRRCEECGFDLAPARKLVERSNIFYNRGLRMAQVRNLTAAVSVLEKSLEFDKHNSDARNLLGLIYYEMGDIVNALSAWLVSRHLDPEDNEADYFLERVQRDTTKLDDMNQAIKKYNLALEEARQHNFDLAVIQLKRSLTLNRKLVKAYQLLSLIYMETGENSKAFRLINMGLKVDMGNTVLLQYRQELTGSSIEGEGDEDILDSADTKDKPIEAKFSYKEEKPSILPFVNLIIGVVLGIICAQWLIVPTVKKNMKEEYESSKIDYSAELSAKSATISQLQKTITNLEKEIAKLNGKAGAYGDGINIDVDNESYEKFFEAWEEYKKFLAKKEYPDEDLVTLAYKLWKIDENEIAQEYAINILKSMRAEIYPAASQKVYLKAKNLYEKGIYDDAIDWFRAASDMDPSYDSPLYYLGKTYQALERYEEAMDSYRKMLEVAPNSTLKEMVSERIKECEKQESAPD
jgi:tetratricopeptide (TPR) repeat protein